MAYGDPVTHATGDVFPASDWNSYVRDVARFLHDQGADLASAATIAPTTQFHKVTGTTQINNITSASHTRLWLWFTGAAVLGHNQAGAGKMILSGGANLQIVANQVVEFVYDATGGVWYQVGSTGTTTQLADTTLAVDTASFDFQSLAVGGYLEIFIYGRTTQAAVTSTGILRLNNDSGGNYDYERLRVTGAATTPTDNAGQTSYFLGSFPGANATANRFGSARHTIPHYANATQMKAIQGQYGGFETVTGFFAEIYGGGWRSTAAVNRVTMLPGSGNWLAASRAGVYARSSA